MTNIAVVIERVVEARRRENQEDLAHSTAGSQLPETIERIRSAYHQDWENRRLGEAQALRVILAEGIPVPVLSACGHGTAETRYTQYLAYFLSPSKPHGLGARYLDGLLSLMRLSNPSIPGDIDATEAIVEAEVYIGSAPGHNDSPVGCTCDVVIECPGYVIFIEHKVKSGQSAHPNSSDRQLDRYDIAIDRNPAYRGKSKIRIYLTPGGNASSGLVDWVGLSHSDLAQVALDLLRSGGLSATARENLLRFGVDLALGPYERAEDEIRDLEARAISATRDADFGERLRFDRIVDRNRLLVDLLLEGSR
ncbi:MAG: PD-(D/E)XK nuclease family protein [Actinobacteria bacterium]|nr:PD-(D/E)XK nuclease family protein [Actinomycetota bacterium]